MNTYINTKLFYFKVQLSLISLIIIQLQIIHNYLNTRYNLIKYLHIILIRRHLVGKQFDYSFEIKWFLLTHVPVYKMVT